MYNRTCKRALRYLELMTLVLSLDALNTELMIILTEEMLINDYHVNYITQK